MSRTPAAVTYFDGRPVVREAALPKARQWEEWLAWRIDDGSGRPRWADFLRDFIVEAHRHRTTVARRLRGRPAWDRAGAGEEDWMGLEEQATERLARWKREYPTELKHAPHWAQKLATALEGVLAQDVRVGREVDEVKAEHGIHAVNVNPRARLDEFPEQ